MAFEVVTLGFPRAARAIHAAEGGLGTPIQGSFKAGAVGKQRENRCSAMNGSERTMPCKWCVYCRICCVLLEARSGFEPLNKGFADLCLTTWLPRLIVRTFRYYTFEWERGAPGPDPQEWHRQARNGSPSPSSAARFAVEGVRRTARFLRPSKPARTPTTASSQNNPPSPSIPHAVADLAEASRLAAIAEDSNRRPAQQLIEDNQAGTGTTKTSWNLSSSNGRLYAH